MKGALIKKGSKVFGLLLLCLILSGVFSGLASAKSAHGSSLTISPSKIVESASGGAYAGGDIAFTLVGKGLTPGDLYNLSTGLNCRATVLVNPFPADNNGRLIVAVQAGPDYTGSGPACNPGKFGISATDQSTGATFNAVATILPPQP